MKMKRIHTIFFMTMLFLNMSVNAGNSLDEYQDVMYLKTIKTDNPNDVRLYLCLKNTSFTVKSLQCTIVLPDGVSFINNESGYDIEKSDIINDNWTLIAKHKNGDQDNSAIILLYNAINAEQIIETGDRIISTLPLKLNDAQALNKESVLIKDVTLTGADLKEYSGDSYAFNINSIIYGDVNNDGAVDISDYIGVANYILGHAPNGFNEIAADVNNDETIDISDYIGVANIILKGKP